MMTMLCVALVSFVLLGACTRAGDTQSERANRTVVITMRDNHFEPDKVEVKRGETVAFRFINRGRARHDAFIGDEQEQAAHEKEARAAQDGHGEHMTGSETDGVIVEPGKSATLVETFGQESKTLIGCHEPGHYKEGMVVTVTVT